MYQLLYTVYFALQRSKKKIIDSGKDCSGTRIRFINFLIGYIEAYYNLYVVKQFTKRPGTKKGVTDRKRDQKIIVSLTSYPARIDNVWITIETLLRQTVKPDMIILWLAREQFASIDDLPEKLLKQQERGLTIRFCDDLRSHKKYFYVMQEYTNDLIVLADDDFIYPSDLIYQLMKFHNQNPTDIISSSVALVKDVNDLPDKWGRPSYNERIKHAVNAQPFSGSGSLFPSRSLDTEYLFNRQLITELCPYADDLWLYYAALKKGTKVSCIYKCRSFPVEIYGTGSSSLWKINGERKMNDQQWKLILRHFHETGETLFPVNS